MKKRFLHDCCMFFIAAVYAYIFSLFSNDFFRDRGNYVAYASNYQEIFLKYDSLLVKAFNEPLFLFLNYFSSYFFAPEDVPKFFVFVVSFSVAYFLLKGARNIVMLLLAAMMLVFVAQLFHLQLVTLRQGLGVSLIIWSVIFFKRDVPIAACIFFAGFIHSSFFIVFVIYMVDVVVSEGGRFKRYYFRLLSQLVVAIAIALGFVYVAQALGARQAEADHLTGGVNVGGGALVLWALVFFFFLTESRQRFYSSQNVRLAYIGLISYLSMYLISPLAGRFIISFLPFILFALVSRFRWRNLACGFLVLGANSIFFMDTIKSNSLTPYGADALGF